MIGSASVGGDGGTLVEGDAVEGVCDGGTLVISGCGASGGREGV